MTHPDDTHPRMRAHKGNVPSLPQTKCCTLCPAKFTRTTHLNRHLRSHTNERLHRCDLCKTAEFTRSDLLTRHKRSCGQSINRSRRKSCEACAESKIKCNLQYPCAKCISRGRECIFQNDPEESRNGAKAASSSSSSRTSPQPTRPPTSAEAIPSLECAPSPLPPLSLSLTVPELSGDISPDSPNWSSHPDFDMSFGVGTVQDGTFVSAGILGVEMEMDTNGADVYHHESGMSLDSLGTTMHDLDQAEMAGLDLLSNMSIPPPAEHRRARAMGMPSPYISLLTPAFDDLDMGCLSAAPAQPLDTYLTLFFTRFLTQVPLIHIPTWKMENTPPLLARVFHACGALFVKTREAATFVTDTFTSITAEIAVILGEAGDGSMSSVAVEEAEGRLHLILALVLLQTICLFKRESDGFAPNERHHTMLVSMIRKKDLVQRIGRWTAPELKTPALLEVAWVEWAKYATIQRAVLLAYFHDCCHVMYSSAPPRFSSSELDGVFLPCDEALWGAASAPEWYAVMYTPTPYAMGVGRIYGVRMGVALNALYADPGVVSSDGDPDQAQAQEQSLECPPLPPFALFLLIHTVLKNISVAQREANGGAHGPAHREFMARTQSVLDNWLRMWLASPDAAPEGAGDSSTIAAAVDGASGKEREPPFVCNPLPFYSLAQVSLWDTFGGD
ncbi:hypothetical protein FB45DRAFT_1064171 [Roridomyces roridus]|uniref:Uncharacterized protein n=1 Tax=Roridomyces roridus TaxID=1738132 RepID=A0AAD7FEX0_9AGAR|nr:hypothetical protein FB45DRAFT_1064171 [Roridomyces roridus]